MEKKELTEEQKLEKTRKLSIKEGSAASVAGGAGEAYITPFALALNANNAEIGILSSFGGLFGPIAQIAGSKLMEKYERKKLILTFVTLQAASWLLILSAGIFFLSKFNPEFIIPFLIFSYITYIVLGNLGGPPWFSMMGDIVPEKMRGKYFSKRNIINGSISILITIIAALWLDYTKRIDIAIIGFIALFIVASIGRFISAYTFTKHYIPKLKLEKGYYFSFWQFIKKAPSNNFGKFAIYIALINLTVNFAAPFFAVYMLKDLNFNYFLFTIVNISAGIFTIIFMPLCGKLADKYGNRELLKFGSIIIPFIPFFWLFSSNPVYLILVPQLISGIGWASFNLASSNFIFDAVTSQRRGIVVAYYSLLNGIAVFIGAGLGGLTAQYLNISFMNIFLFIFLISGITRLIVVILMLNKIKEVRKTEHPAKNNPLMYIQEMIPLYDSIKEIKIIRRIKKKNNK